MLDDTDATERLRRALEAVQHPTGFPDTGSVNAQPIRQLLDEYTTRVRRLRAVVRDAEARLSEVAGVLRKGAIVVRRERARVEPPGQSSAH